MTTKDEVRGTFSSTTGSSVADLAKSLVGADPGQVVPQARASKSVEAGPVPVSENRTNRAVRGLFAGLGAGGSAGSSYDGRTAAVNIGASTLEGGVAGFLSGGAPGAAAGATLGLVTSSLNAWLQVDAENKRRSEMDALIREMQAKEDAREKRDRADDLSALKYNRKQAELEQAWGVAQSNRAKVNELLDKNQTLRDRWVQTGSIQ
jgi:hypothetical protein